MSAAPRIAVTAYALANALGDDTAAVLDQIFRGVQRFTAPAAFDLPFPTYVGQMFDLAPAADLDPRYDSRLVRIAMRGARQLREPVSAAIERYGAHRVTFVLGSSTGGMAETERAYPRLRAGEPAPGYLHDYQHPLAVSADVIAAWFGISGPRLVVSTACSSSGKALGTARRLLRYNAADAVVVGGVDSLCRLTLFGFHSLGVLSESPHARSPPIGTASPSAKGAAFAVLDAHAESSVYFAGIGESSDAHHLSSPDPEGVGVRAAMEGALADAGVKPDEVDHVNAHGTGTLQNDAVEGRALRATFGRPLPITSTKFTTGHLLGAGGLTEAIVAMASIECGQIPPTVGSGTVDPELGVTLVRECTPHVSRIVLSNSFGFGGSNVSVLISS